MSMPTPRVVQAIVRQRTSVVIDGPEAVRLIAQAAARPTEELPIDIFGRDWRTGTPVTARLTVHDLLVPPDGFLSPA
jgi:hypothetical protein